MDNALILTDDYMQEYRVSKIKADAIREMLNDSVFRSKVGLTDSAEYEVNKYADKLEGKK